MLACDPLSFAKLLWPLVESFYAPMIKIMYTHIYMLAPTPGVMQNMPSIHQKNKYSKVQRDFSFCNLAKGERGHWKKGICSKSIEKNVLQSNSIEKRKKSMSPLQNKSKRRISKWGLLRKTKNIFQTLAYLDQVAWLVSSWVRSLAQQHHVAQVSLILILPKSSTYKP
jgi:hypothetical protein